jgi:hypothetical protein
MTKKEKDDDDDDGDHDGENPASVVIIQPLTITIRTALMETICNNAPSTRTLLVSILDQSIELTVNRSRNVASLKQVCRGGVGATACRRLADTAPAKVF